MRRVLVLSLLSLAAAGCKPAPAPAPVREPHANARFDTTLNTRTVMTGLIQPAADIYWSGWGADADEGGLHDHTPATPEEWARLTSGAIMLVEAGNVLQLPGRVRTPSEDWLRHARHMTATAQAARKAAEAHDRDAMVEQGNRLYRACAACHQQFAPAIAPKG